jgi:hypothetical protein
MDMIRIAEITLAILLAELVNAIIRALRRGAASKAA